MADTLYSLSGGKFASPADRRNVGSLQGRLQVQWWWESGTHAFLDSLLPGARFLHEHWYQMGSYGFFGRSNWAMYKGRLYDFDGLNRLMNDAGFQFSESSMVQAAKAAVLLSVFLREADSAGRLVPVLEEKGLAPGPHAFPSVRFLDAKATSLETRGKPGWGRDVTLDCIIDGVMAHFRVTFLGSAANGKAKPQPFIVWLDGSVILQLRLVPTSELRGEHRGARGSGRDTSPTPVPRWGIR